MIKDETKNKIVEQIKKTENRISDVQIVSVSAGILVQLIGSNDFNKSVNKILSEIIEIHRNGKSGEAVFPFHIYTYNSESESFKIGAILHTKRHDYPRGIRTTYLQGDDAIVQMREIDASALSYGVKMPFTFTVISENELFKPSEKIKYEELEVSGGTFNFENAEIIQPDDTSNSKYWKITLRQ